MKKAILSIALLGGIFFSTNAAAQTETSGREKVYRATHTKVTELKHTKLKVDFDYQKVAHGSPFLLSCQRTYAGCQRHAHP